jgi:hypothetical protein
LLQKVRFVQTKTFPVGTPSKDPRHSLAFGPVDRDSRASKGVFFWPGNSTSPGPEMTRFCEKPLMAQHPMIRAAAISLQLLCMDVLLQEWVDRVGDERYLSLLA